MKRRVPERSNGSILASSKSKTHRFGEIGAKNNRGKNYGSEEYRFKGVKGRKDTVRKESSIQETSFQKTYRAYGHRFEQIIDSKNTVS